MTCTGMLNESMVLIHVLHMYCNLKYQHATWSEPWIHRNHGLTTHQNSVKLQDCTVAFHTEPDGLTWPEPWPEFRHATRPKPWTHQTTHRLECSITQSVCTEQSQSVQSLHTGTDDILHVVADRLSETVTPKIFSDESTLGRSPVVRAAATQCDGFVKTISTLFVRFKWTTITSVVFTRWHKPYRPTLLAHIRFQLTTHLSSQKDER